VGPQGRVLAVDIDQEILGYLKGEAQKLGLNQVEIVVSKEDDPMLSPDSIDLAFSCDTSHHIRNRVPFYAKVNRALKPNGRLAVLDIPPDAHTKGLCRHKVEELVPRDQAIEEAKAAGFVLVEEYNFVLPRQYFLVFQKK
jgi:SAM-dependent methyltransferase